MKEVKAYIKPFKVDAVVSALHLIKGLTGLSVVGVHGFGRSRVRGEHRIAGDLGSDVPHVKLEVVCLDELVDEVVSAIEKAAHTGRRGDGKIYVNSVEFAVRIESGERGEAGV